MVFMKFDKKNKVEILVVGTDDFHALFNDLESNVRCIKSLKSIFPSLYMFCPAVVIVEYEHFKSAFDYYLMRIRANKYYDKLKVYCCINEPDESLLEYLKTFRSQTILSSEVNQQRLRLF